MHVTLGQIVAAVIVGIPAIAAAISSRKSKQNTDTRNGANLGTILERLATDFGEFRGEVNRRLGQLEKHVETPSGDKLGEVVERTHDLAAVSVAATTKKGTN